MPNSSLEALAASSGNKAHVWQPFSKESDLNYFSVASEGKVYCVQWNQNNKVIVSGGQTGIVTLNYNKDGALMGTLPKDVPTQEDRLSAISSIAFSRGSKLLAAGCMDSSVRVWDLKQQVCKYFLESHKAAVTYVTFSTDDQHLASACLTGEIHMHTVRQTSQAAVLRTPGNRAKRSLHFTPLEPLFASGAEDGSLYVWDTTTYTLLDSYIQTHSATVSRVCFSPGSPNILISAGLDRSIILTDRRLDAAIASVACPAPLTALDCKDDGNCITVGNTTGRVQLFDPRKLQTPFSELSCAGGEPVSCLHWQQASSSSKSAKKGATPAPGAGLANNSTPARSRSVIRGQELLSAASPATPMLAHRQAEVAPPTDRLDARRTTSAASDQSISTSDTSFLSAQPGADRTGGVAELGEPASLRHSSRPRGELRSASATHASQNGNSRSLAPDARNPLFTAVEPLPRPSASRHTAEAARPDAGASNSSLRGLAGSPVPSREPPQQQEQSRRSSGLLPAPAKPDSGPNGSPSLALAESGRQPSNNPGFDVEVAAASPREESLPDANSAAASFGERLKRLMGAQAEAAVLEAEAEHAKHPGGGGYKLQEALGSRPPEASASWVQLAEDIKGSISSDIKTLHFEMIRQFHIQQAEMKELVEKVVARQDSLVDEVARLRARVQQLSHGRASNSVFP